MYDLLYDRRFAKDLKSIPDDDKKRLKARIRDLAAEPRPTGCKKLGGAEYRIRVGSYRVIYAVDDDSRTVVIARVRRRNESTYRDQA